jgi:hypothetical protein
LSLSAHAAGQTPGREGVETDLTRCWWKTSVPAVRVGEAFSVVLTSPSKPTSHGGPESASST